MQKPRVTNIQLRMDCNGCVKKIKKVLIGINGISNVHIDFPQQKITITGWAEPEKIIKAIKKTKKIITIHSITHPPLKAEGPPQEPPPKVEEPPQEPPQGPQPSSNGYRHRGFDHDPTYETLTHSYNMHKPSPYITQYDYAPSFLPYRNEFYEYTYCNYNEEEHNNIEYDSNANIMTLFSDENPNACTIM